MKSTHEEVMAKLEDFVSKEVAEYARKLWAALVAECAPPQSIIEVTEVQGVRFAWSDYQEYLDVEVDHDGYFEWFWTDRKRESPPEGTEDEPEKKLPSRFFARLRLLVERRRRTGEGNVL